MRSYWVYILKCSDGSYYTGVTNDLETRVFQHEEGWDPESYTYSRRPLELVFAHEFDSVNDAIAREKQIQGWSRKKKEALIKEDWNQIHRLAMNKKNRERHTRSTIEK